MVQWFPATPIRALKNLEGHQLWLFLRKLTSNAGTNLFFKVWTLKLRLHGTRQAARLRRDMLQRDLLRGNSVCMIGSCRARLLHINHVSAVFKVGVLQEKCSGQPVPRGNYKFKLKMPPGLAAVARLLRAARRRVNAPVAFLCFIFAARLSRRSRAACRVPCKRSSMS